MNAQARLPAHIVDRAYAKLPDWDKMLIEHQVRKLTGIRNVGPIVAKEVLAHLGALLEEKA